jgi:hypothetical protein
MFGRVHGVAVPVRDPYAGLIPGNAAENQRAAILRRRLLDAAADLGTDESPEAGLIREAWQETPSKNQLGQRKARPLLDDSKSTRLFSLWA